MQKVNTILNVVLLVAVAYLLLDKFSNGEGSENSALELVDSLKTPSELLPGVGRIGFINVDTLTLKYNYLQDKNKELQAEEKRMERRVKNKIKRAEERAIELQQSVQTMTEAQYYAAQEELQKLDMEIQEYQAKLTKDLLTLQSDLNNDLKVRLLEQLEMVNSKHGYDHILSMQDGGGLLLAHDSLNITDEVLDIIFSLCEEELQESDGEQ